MAALRQVVKTSQILASRGLATSSMAKASKFDLFSTILTNFKSILTLQK